jgi:sialate O-acetylesterase
MRTDIHPKNKQDVGKRLALGGMLKYGCTKIPVTYQGPQFSGVNFNGSQALVHFQNTAPGLEVKDKYGYLRRI